MNKHRTLDDLLNDWLDRDLNPEELDKAKAALKQSFIECLGEKMEELDFGDNQWVRGYNAHHQQAINRIERAFK